MVHLEIFNECKLWRSFSSLNWTSVLLLLFRFTRKKAVLSHDLPQWLTWYGFHPLCKPLKVKPYLYSSINSKKVETKRKLTRIKSKWRKLDSLRPTGALLCVTVGLMDPSLCSSPVSVSINCGGKANHAVTKILIIEFLSSSTVSFASQSIPKFHTQNFNWQK